MCMIVGFVVEHFHLISFLNDFRIVSLLALLLVGLSQMVLALLPIQLTLSVEE
jgi:hypothetical protein